MIKNADIDAGAKVFKKCATCHTLTQGGANKVGPNLYGVIGKKRASISGFAYSNAMKAKGGVWTIEDMNIWLAKPKDFVPGTKMGFAGLKKDKDRAHDKALKALLPPGLLLSLLPIPALFFVVLLRSMGLTQ